MEFFLIPLLLLFSAFFSASETAFFALRRVDLLRWKEEGNRRGGLIEKMLDSPSSLITTIFIGNEIANVSISSLVAGLIVPLYPGYGKALATAVGMLLILVVGDIGPKSVVWHRASAFSLFAVRPFRIFARVVAPIRLVLEGMANGILSLVGGGTLSSTWGVLSEREFRALVDVGEESGTLEPGETELIHNIFEMSEQRAGEIMTPLADVFMVPAGLPWPELVAAIGRYRRSRIPVYEGERQNVVGVLYARELIGPMADGEPVVDWRSLVVPPVVVPASKKLPLLLRQFQQRKIHMALLVDEFGEVVGIITLEDVLEELFGEIMEEHDREEREVKPGPGGTHRVLGKMPVYRFNERFGTALPDAEWDTVAGLLLHEFGRLPSRGDSIVLGGHLFVVERLKGIRIVEVSVKPVSESGG
jgi:CBS domain containing-hemolysin-like protein